jgi:hypothetical protein
VAPSVTDAQPASAQPTKAAVAANLANSNISPSTGFAVCAGSLYEAVHADGSIEEAADDFGVSADDVRQAFGWEKELDLRTLH